MSRPKTLVRIMSLLLVASLTVAAAAPASAVSTVTVSIPKGAGYPNGAPGYAPATITVVIGVNNTVLFTNNDTGVPHTVTPASEPAGGNWPSAGSGNMDSGTSYTFTFTVPGTYTYTCQYHSWMFGKVIVKGNATTSTTSTTSSTSSTTSTTSSTSSTSSTTSSSKSTTSSSSTTTTTTPEFPSAWLGAILLVVVVGAVLAASRFRPTPLSASKAS